MKTIALTGPGDKDILSGILTHAAEGMDIKGFRSALKILDKVEAADTTLALEDAEHDFLLMRFRATKFVRADRALVSLYERLETA